MTANAVADDRWTWERYDKVKLELDTRVHTDIITLQEAITGIQRILDCEEEMSWDDACTDIQAHELASRALVIVNEIILRLRQDGSQSVFHLGSRAVGGILEAETETLGIDRVHGLNTHQTGIYGRINELKTATAQFEAIKLYRPELSMLRRIKRGLIESSKKK
jgi:hypothetical protein